MGPNHLFGREAHKEVLDEALQLPPFSEDITTLPWPSLLTVLLQVGSFLQGSLGRLVGDQAAPTGVTRRHGKRRRCQERQLQPPAKPRWLM